METLSGELLQGKPPGVSSTGDITPGMQSRAPKPTPTSHSPASSRGESPCSEGLGDWPEEVTPGDEPQRRRMKTGQGHRPDSPGEGQGEEGSRPPAAAPGFPGGKVRVPVLAVTVRCALGLSRGWEQSRPH